MPSTRRSEPFEALIASIWGEEISAQAVVFPRVLQEYANVSSDEFHRVPLPREIDFVIDTLPGTSLIALPMYRMSLTELVEMQTQIANVERLGFICRSMLPWASPVLFTKKKDDILRLCIDYSKLNATIVKKIPTSKDR